MRTDLQAGEQEDIEREAVGMAETVVSLLMLAAAKDQPLRPICAGGRQGANLLLFHAESEGSHALSDALDNIACVHFIRSESFKSQVDVLRAFFTSPPNTWQQATVSAALAGNLTDHKHLQHLAVVMGEFKEAETRDRCLCTSRGSLVRLDILDGNFKGDNRWTSEEVQRAVRDLCPLFNPADGSPPVRPVMLVRTDPMRWALSIYGRLVDGMQNNPQFTTGQISAMEYDLKKLQQAMAQNLHAWRIKADILEALRTVCGVRPAVHVYETFDMRQGLPEGMADFLLPCYNGTADTLPVDDEQTVRHAHSYTIQEFVSNAEEVVAMFAMADFPTFGQVLAERGLSIADLDDFSEPKKMSQACNAVMPQDT